MAAAGGAGGGGAPRYETVVRAAICASLHDTMLITTRCHMQCSPERYTMPCFLVHPHAAPSMFHADCVFMQNAELFTLTYGAIVTQVRVVMLSKLHAMPRDGRIIVLNDAHRGADPAFMASCEPLHRCFDLPCLVLPCQCTQRFHSLTARADTPRQPPLLSCLNKPATCS